MIKTIFFDLDGVLTTEKTGSITTSKYFAKKLGVNFQEVFEYKKKFDGDTDIGKISDFDIWKKTCEKFGCRFSLEHLHEAFLSTPIDEKMVQYAIKLKSKYIVGIITDNSIGRIDAIVEKNNWSNIFDVIIISEEVRSTKKETKIFEIATQRANVNSEECIFIDNSQKNIDSAQKAGFVGVYFDDEIRDYENLFKMIDEIIMD